MSARWKRTCWQGPISERAWWNRLDLDKHLLRQIVQQVPEHLLILPDPDRVLLVRHADVLPLLVLDDDRFWCVSFSKTCVVGAGKELDDDAMVFGFVFRLDVVRKVCCDYHIEFML